MEYGYSPKAVHHDPIRRLWSLALGAAAPWRAHIGPEATEVRDARHRILARGMMTADAPVILKRPGGGTLRLDPVEIGTGFPVILASERLEPGVVYSQAETALGARLSATPEQIADLPCLATGTMIATDDGPQPVDWLRPGDRVLTRDNGYQPLLWLGQMTLPRHCPDAARPLTIAPATFGADLPAAALTLTRGQRIVLAGPELDLWFGDSEVSARADELLAAPARIANGQRHLYSLLFRAPEVILAEGLWVESVQAAPDYLALLPDRTRHALQPQLSRSHALTVRAWLKDWETALFVAETKAGKARLAA